MNVCWFARLTRK